MRIEYRGTKVETEIKIELILTWTRKVGPCEKWSNSRHIRKGFLADDELNVGVKKKKKKNVLKDVTLGVPVVAQWLTNPTRNHEVAGSIPGLDQWVKDPGLP